MEDNPNHTPTTEGELLLDSELLDCLSEDEFSLWLRRGIPDARLRLIRLSRWLHLGSSCHPGSAATLHSPMDLFFGLFLFLPLFLPLNFVRFEWPRGHLTDV